MVTELEPSSPVFHFGDKNCGPMEVTWEAEVSDAQQVKDALFFLKLRDTDTRRYTDWRGRQARPCSPELPVPGAIGHLFHRNSALTSKRYSWRPLRDGTNLDLGGSNQRFVGAEDKRIQKPQRSQP
jgi:hypothetical protein